MASSLVLMTLGLYDGALYDQIEVGMNMPTCLWYSTYSGYLPAEIASVSQVDPWKRRNKLPEPTKVQLYRELVA